MMTYHSIVKWAWCTNAIRSSDWERTVLDIIFNDPPLLLIHPVNLSTMMNGYDRCANILKLLCFTAMFFMLRTVAQLNWSKRYALFSVCWISATFSIFSVSYQSISINVNKVCHWWIRYLVYLVRSINVRNGAISHKILLAIRITPCS